ncbi:hypothetical protein EVAR_100941_1 [Eumeta japonica]|uniref:Uncharacterized protein n=1 Tax=Eumeta variegata TaxID=151549 RepID=A0A4C2A1N8_EUMVA|nr:hypothetical protein EVAR_100941_1 [Eumeta japonica]
MEIIGHLIKSADDVLETFEIGLRARKKASDMGVYRMAPATLAEILGFDEDGVIPEPHHGLSSEFEDNRIPKLFSQGQLNDLVKYLNLSKDADERKTRNLLLPGVSSYWFRYLKKEFTRYFSLEDNRDQANHWTEKFWQPRELKVGEKNFLQKTWIPQHKVLLPPLHIKLGLMKHFENHFLEMEPIPRLLAIQEADSTRVTPLRVVSAMASVTTYWLLKRLFAP